MSSQAREEQMIETGKPAAGVFPLGLAAVKQTRKRAPVRRGAFISVHTRLRSNVQQNGTEHDRSIPFARLMPPTKAQVRPYAAAARPSFRDAISAPFRRFVIFWKAISRATSGEPCLGLTSMENGEKPQSSVAPS